MDNQSRIKELLLEQFQNKNAHVTFEEAIKGVSYHDVGIRPEGLPHSIWELVEHIRLAQFDILDFSRNADYDPPEWPEDYWPEMAHPTDESQWKESLESIRKDRQAVVNLIQNPETDVLKPLAHGSGQTLFREAMLIVDHNAYHIGQIVQVRRLLGTW